MEELLNFAISKLGEDHGIFYIYLNLRLFGGIKTRDIFMTVTVFPLMTTLLKFKILCLQYNCGLVFSLFTQ